MPDKTAQDFAQRPILAIAAFCDGILQKFRVRFQRFKSPLAVFVYIAVMTGIHSNLRKIICIHILVYAPTKFVA